MAVPFLKTLPLAALLSCLAGAVSLPAFATSPAPALPAQSVAALPVPPIPAMIGEMQTTSTRYEDTLVHLARKYGVGFVEMRAANPGIDPWLPGSGTRITIPTQYLLPNAPQRGVVINLSEMRLYYYEKPGEAPATFPIGIGRSGLTTPVGTTFVARKVVDPVWYPTERMRREDPTLKAAVPPGPENPMGTHAMYLGWESYAIHGTDKPYSIGRRLSSGCIRMYPEDIITLFERVGPNTPVTVVDQPIKTAWVGDTFYIEVHPTQEQSDILSRDNGNLPDYQMSERDMRTLLRGAGEWVEKLDWPKIREAVKERRGIPIAVATRPRQKTEPTITTAKPQAELIKASSTEVLSDKEKAKPDIAHRRVDSTVTKEPRGID